MKGVRGMALLLVIVGGFLYLASYFWGGLCVVAGLILEGYVWYRGEGKRAFVDHAKAFGTRCSTPAIGIGSALIIGAVIMVATGYDPISSYAALFYGGFIRNWHIAVLNATPLIFTGLAIAFAFHGGLFNIGAEGQYYIGVIMATWLGLELSPAIPSGVAILLVYLAAMLCGALLNLIPVFLKIKTGAHEVVTTMMLAYAVRTLSPMFIRAYGGDPLKSSHPYATNSIGARLWLPLFQKILPNANYRLHVGILLAIASAFLVRFILTKTDLGYKIRAIGHNVVAARTYGIPVGWMMAASLFISGALAAMAGATQVLGLDHRMYQDLNAGYGWNGISVALLARNNPIAIVFTALLWGALDAGGQYMARTTHTPNAIIEIVKGIILFLMLAETIYVKVRKYGGMLRREKLGASPRAGEGGR